MNEETGAPVALDVWLRFDDDNDEESAYEANTYRTPETDGLRAGYVVEWYHTAVGQVSRVWFSTYSEATEWLEANGYQDFSS